MGRKRTSTEGYLNPVQHKDRPKYRYLSLARDERVKPHKKGLYPKRDVFVANMGPIVDIGNPDLKKKKLAQMETKNLKGKEKEIVMELVMLGFRQATDMVFVKDNKYYVDLNNKEVKRKQKSFPKDTKISFKKIVIPTSLDHILPRGYLCDYTLRK